MNVIFLGEIRNVNSLVDRSFKIVLGTPELKSEDVTRIIDLRGKPVKVLVSDAGVSASMVEELEKVMIDVEDDGKSPAQRLRAVLYRLWEVEPENYNDFNLYYKYKINRIIDKYKEILTEKTS